MKKVLLSLAVLATALCPVTARAIPGMPVPPPPIPSPTATPPPPNMLPYMTCTHALAAERDRCMADGPRENAEITGLVRTAVCYAFYYIRLQFCDCVQPRNAAWCADECQHNYKRCVAFADEQYIYCSAQSDIAECQASHARRICICEENSIYCPNAVPWGGYDHCPDLPDDPPLLPLPGNNPPLPAMAPPVAPPVLATTVTPAATPPMMMPPAMPSN